MCLKQVEESWSVFCKDRECNECSAKILNYFTGDNYPMMEYLTGSNATRTFNEFLGRSLHL